MRRLRYAAALARLTCILCLPPTLAHGQFTLFSQNTLHFGWGKNPYYTTKNTYMSQHVVNAAAPNWGVVILQETMNNNDLALLYPNPGNYLFLQTAPLGQTSYVERYSFLIRVPTVLGACCTVISSAAGNQVTVYADPNNRYSRPPAGVVVTGATVPETWIIDYHAVFGRVGQRRTEVSTGGAAIQAFQGTPMGTNNHLVSRFVMGGDWNFPATDAAFTNIQISLGVAISVQPTAKTSLKRNGGLSQPYDHFLWVSNNASPAYVNCTNPAVVPPPNGQTQAWFRTNYSDHLGVSINVQ